MSYSIEFKDIPLEIYLRLRKESGLSAKTEEAGRIGLKNSVCSVLVTDPESGNAAIGMGRLIGDGGCHCQVTDICVSPEYQGKGLGKAIMEKLMEFITNELPASCYISLIADGDASFLYEKFGFKDTMPQSKGMYYKK
ncbi:GNAT family N-acetyltransferase [Pedobacter caeni]|uniref:Acetyltransferase (GNAT) domain-containing protein n=1 Tax=Pedobacter caeni TaxID=288992 RepID=A0A1M5G7P5_9SPHI|nr:GNAT family N-acetyltransferase [Pedobacter caeni]SHF99471.1 Acetyltransferase (GNAT) domain-containing protein [Pedobacter caeni]